MGRLRLVVVFATLVPTVGQCLDITVQAGYGATYTNNTQEAPEHGTGEWIQEPEVSFAATHDGTSTSLATDYNVTRQIHQRDIYGDDTIVSGVAAATWYAIPDRLTLDAENARTQTTINARGTDTPNNLQVIDTTTAGGTVMMNAFRDHRIDLSYHYALENATDTNTDSRRQYGTLSYVIPTGATRRLQFNVSGGKVNYDSSGAVNYTSREADVEYVVESERVDMDMSLGYTVFDQQDQLDDITGTTGSFDLRWRATATSTLVAAYSRSLGDGAMDVSGGGLGQFGQPGVSENSGLTQPYTAQQANLGFDTQVGHNTVTLAGYLRDQKYEDISDEDQKTAGSTIRIERHLRQELSATAYVDYSSTQFEGDSRTDHDFDAGLQLHWARWRNLSLFASTVYTRRNSDDPTAEFTEWQGSFGFVYTLTGGVDRTGSRAQGVGRANTHSINGGGHQYH